jgi:hypothetical protein
MSPANSSATGRVRYCKVRKNGQFSQLEFRFLKAYPAVRGRLGTNYFMGLILLFIFESGNFFVVLVNLVILEIFPYTN